jgi:ammonium transporter Rh
MTNIDLSRSAVEQGGYQMAALALTIVFAIVGGVLTGFIMRLPIFEQVENQDDMFDDETNWITPEDFALKLTEVSVQNQNQEDDEEEKQLNIHQTNV